MNGRIQEKLTFSSLLRALVMLAFRADSMRHAAWLIEEVAATELQIKALFSDMY